jgi:hypothetical protein
MWILAAVVATLSRALPASSFHAALHPPRKVCWNGSKVHTRNLRHCVHIAAAPAGGSRHRYTQTMSTATGADSGRAVHNAKQAASFDQSVGYFASDAATPPEVSKDMLLSDDASTTSICKLLVIQLRPHCDMTVRAGCAKASQNCCSCCCSCAEATGRCYSSSSTAKTCRCWHWHWLLDTTLPRGQCNCSHL